MSNCSSNTNGSFNKSGLKFNPKNALINQKASRKVSVNSFNEEIGVSPTEESKPISTQASTDQDQIRK